LFVQLDLETVSLSELQWIPGAVRIVCVGGEACPIPSELIMAIKHQVEKINTLGGKVDNYLKAGDPVIVLDGPLTGYQAIFDSRISGGQRVRILLKILQDRQVSVTLLSEQIRLKKSH
jgi:transcription antitermination factor NusG